MSRILMAWELGANYGHIAQLAAVAVPLRAAGHRLLFAVRDVATASEVLGPLRLDFVQAPALLRHRRAPAPPANHAEMLAFEGYSDLQSARGLVGGWLTLVRMFDAEAIVADCAPGALIAGRILALPRVQVGTGFSVPPLTAPMPSIRPWDSIPAARLERSEHHVAELLNRVIRSHHGAELACLADLFRTEGRVLATFPELDPFGPRPGEAYVGPIFEHSSGDRVAWPQPEPPRILAYLRGDVTGADNIVQALKAASAGTICVYPGLRGTTSKELASDRLCIATRPISLAPVLREANLALLYGGHGVLSAALAAGVPMVIAPHTVEQYLHARRAEAAGVAVIVGSNRSVPAVSECITRALSDASLKAAARNFAVRHAGFQPGQAISAAAARIVSVVGSAGSVR